tara:strand:+ start:5917 stop:7173 length:1257 start_codon:yes stop_codon:yes gene_type:complete
MSTSTLIIPPLTVRNWEKKMDKQLIKQSVWAQLSNRMVQTAAIPNGGEQKIPDSVVHYVSGKFTPGVQSVTIPSMDKLTKKGKGGLQSVEGSEEKPKLRYMQAFYNVQRKGLTIKDESVEGDLVNAYPILQSKVDLLTDYFMELEDYNKQRAICQGVDEYLSEADYWTGDSMPTPPASVATHPYVYVRGGTALPAWSATDATYVGNIRTLVNNAGIAAQVFNKDTLDKMVTMASRNVKPLNWKSGSNTVKWVFKISELQAEQLTTTTTGESFNALFREAGGRGVDNRAITGIIGIYKGALVITDERAPLFNSLASVDSKLAFQYIKPWGDERIPVAKTATDGTMEVAQVLGRGAMGCAIIKKLSFNKQGKDYDFSTGFEARRSTGDTRMDFLNPSDLAAKPMNWSSALYMTPTTTGAY